MIGLGGDAISNDVSSLAASGAVGALVVLLGASALAAWRLRSPERSGLAWFAALGSVALVIAVTLLRDGWPTGIDLGRLGEWSRNGWDRMSSDPLGSQVVLNVALFVPAGAAWTWLVDRPWRVLAALVAGSLSNSSRPSSGRCRRRRRRGSQRGRGGDRCRGCGAHPSCVAAAGGRRSPSRRVAGDRCRGRHGAGRRRRADARRREPKRAPPCPASDSGESGAPRSLRQAKYRSPLRC